MAGVLIFILAALMDRLDGYIARRFDQITEFGIIWDPVVDKIWLHSIALAMCLAGYVPALCMWLFLARDLVVTQLRNDHPGNATFKMAEKSGKRKFRFQVAFLALCMVRPWVSFHYPSANTLFLAICAAGFCLAAYFTITSWAAYIEKYAT